MMDREFDEIWNRMHFTFGLTAPNDGRKSLCSQRCRDAIDGRAVEYIKREIDSLDQKPKNIAGWFLARHADWLAEHPSRIATGQREACPHCWMGSGFIYAYRNGALSVDMRFRYAVPCGHCRPAARGAMTVQQIDALGYWIDVPRTGPDIYHTLVDDGLADRLARMVPALARSKAVHPGRAA